VPISTVFKTVPEILASCSWNFVSGLRSRITSYGKISPPTTNKFYNYSTTQLPFNGPEMFVEEAGPEYADAITWCLHHTPESSGVEGNDEKWREDMFMKVVEPLKYCHDQLIIIGGRNVGMT
jgi:hypothetical protein